MKFTNVFAAVLVTIFGVNLYAQPVAPAPAKLKITKITGTVNIMKDGAVLMTLKPGDAIPELTDNSATFAVVDGTIEVEANGKMVSAATGSSFTVSITEGQANVAVGAGTPVAIKTESGHNIILTANSEVKMARTNGTLAVSVVTGNAVITNASGGASQTVTAGQTASIPAALAPVTAAPVAPVIKPVAKTGEVDAPVVVVEPPVSPVIPTETIQEAGTVSGSNP